MAKAIFGALTALFVAAPALAQSEAPAATITLYSLPLYLGQSVTITTATTDLGKLSFAARAQSARVTGAWTACTAAGYKGTCKQLTTSLPSLKIVALSGKIASLKPTYGADTSTAAPATSAATTASASTDAKLDLGTLDADAGTSGQDTAFFATPSLSGSQVSAGTSDKAAGDAFCKQAGFASSAYAGRARAQSSNLIDLTASSKVRAYALRDVLCKR